MTDAPLQARQPSVAAIELVDGGDDGMEEQGWIEATVPADEALRRMQFYNPDPELCAIVLEGTSFLCPADPENRDPEERWHPCSEDARGARKFWWFLAVDKADLDA